eukprot:TRINITY_DN6337_c0_g1_i5.p1 TRINITY_DN6337_c0_g1~~TRINITY_DN6337_c0_g1_i5.p1  ORF type:complete len:329 (+),score=25.82 TRINITY_DN6337_c0_g1_i5:169-1155(+)
MNPKQQTMNEMMTIKKLKSPHLYSTIKFLQIKFISARHHLPEFKWQQMHQYSLCQNRKSKIRMKSTKNSNDHRTYNIDSQQQQQQQQQQQFQLDKQSRQIREIGQTISVGMVCLATAIYLFKIQQTQSLDGFEEFFISNQSMLLPIILFSIFLYFQQETIMDFVWIEKFPGNNRKISFGQITQNEYEDLINSSMNQKQQIVVRDTGDGRGNGAFAVEDIVGGSFVGEYQGDLLDLDQFYDRYPEGVCDYCIGINSQYCLDGAERAQQTQDFSPCHMNHSRQRFNVVRRTLRTQKKVLFFAGREIKKGEELLIDYGRKYWQGRENLELP